jgi:hypothetical protein
MHVVGLKNFHTHATQVVEILREHQRFNTNSSFGGREILSFQLIDKTY